MRRKRVEYGLLLLAVTALHIFLVDYLSFYIFAFFLALPAASLLLAVYAGRYLRAELEINRAVIRKKEALTVRLKVQNRSFLACRVRVKLTLSNELLEEEQTETFLLTAGRMEEFVEQVLTSQYCGKLECRISELRLYDYLGLFSLRKKTGQLEHRVVLIQPSVYPLPDITWGAKIHLNSESDEFSSDKAGDDPGEIFDLREYRSGDRLTRIHWKLSDRLDRLMVKDFGLPISQAVLLLFDLNGKGKELDALLDTLCSISSFLLERQIVHEMEWYDSVHHQNDHVRIAREDDLSAAVNNLLAASRPQFQLLALQNCAGNNGHIRLRYTEVIYLCSEVAQNSLALLAEGMAGSRVRILTVRESGSQQEVDRSLATAMGINMTVVDPENIEKGLGSLAI